MIVDYYLGKAEDGVGKTISDYLSYTNEQLQDEREYITWIFPSTTNSPGYVNPPILSQEEANKFKEDKILREMVRSAVNHYLKYLNNTHLWRGTASQDHLRIARMIRFLATIGMKEEAEKVSRWCCERGGSKRSKESWEASISFKPPWEKEEAKEQPQEP